MLRTMPLAYRVAYARVNATRRDTESRLPLAGCMGWTGCGQEELARLQKRERAAYAAWRKTAPK